MLQQRKMFNLYQSINRKGGDEKDEKDSDVIGHERFYQERRSRSSVRKKKRVTRRTHSAAEFSHSTLEAAKRRAAFCERSQSTEQKDTDGNKTPQRSESFARALFCKR